MADSANRYTRLIEAIFFKHYHVGDSAVDFERADIVQIEQDFAICAAKFPDLVWLPVAAQFLADDVIALFAFEQTESGVAVSAEKHYRLVSPDELSAEELAAYRKRPW